MKKDSKLTWNLELKQEIDKLFIEGESYSSVARLFNMDPSCFRQKIKKLGWDLEYNNNKNKTSKYLEEKKFDKKLRWYSNSTLPNTREYLISNIKNNPSFKAEKGTLLKDDFIEQYYISRETNGLKTFNYDFSKIPEIISSKKTRVPVFVNEVSTKTGKIIGDWKTSYHDLITCLEDNRSCAGMVSKTKTDQYKSTEDFISESKSLFPGKFNYDKTVYVNNHTPVVLRCLHCGDEFTQRPTEHLYGTGKCPVCAMKACGEEKRLSQEEFIKRLELKYGDSIILEKTKYQGLKNRVIITNPKTGEDIEVIADSLLYRDFSFEKIISKGEILVSKCLDSISIDYVLHKKFEKSEIPEIYPFRTAVFVDFFIENYNGITYVIEYNGIQHYRPGSCFPGTNHDYQSQVKRDEAVRKFCDRVGYVLIEIPYTVTTEEDIMNGLISIFKNNIDPKKVFPTITPL